MIQQKGTTSSSFSIIPQDTFNFPNWGRETYLMLSWQNKSILHLLNYHSLHYPRGILLYFANLYSIAKNVFNFKPWTICSTLLYFTYYNSLDQSFPYHLEQPVFLYPSHLYSYVLARPLLLSLTRHLKYKCKGVTLILFFFLLSCTRNKQNMTWLVKTSYLGLSEIFM